MLLRHWLRKHARVGPHEQWRSVCLVAGAGPLSWRRCTSAGTRPRAPPRELHGSSSSEQLPPRACLVHCMCLNQAPRMQQLIVWLPASMFGSGSRGAKSVLQPGSADTEKSSVSRRPGSLDARGACGGAACGKNVKRSTPDPATKQRLSAACSDGRKQPNTHTLHAFSLGVQSLVPC